jgi:hypothetical protein
MYLVKNKNNGDLSISNLRHRCVFGWDIYDTILESRRAYPDMYIDIRDFRIIAPKDFL